jgi:hypothetical protein
MNGLTMDAIGCVPGLMSNTVGQKIFNTLPRADAPGAEVAANKSSVGGATWS